MATRPPTMEAAAAEEESRTPERKRGYEPTSLYRGVCRITQSKKWKASIMGNGKSRILGYFDNEVEAARAYDRAARETFESPVLNFMNDGTTLNPSRKRIGNTKALHGVETTSRYHGVCWHGASSRWIVAIRVGAKHKNLGSFKTEEEAARVYDRAVLTYPDVNPDLPLNFVDESEQAQPPKHGARTHDFFPPTVEIPKSRFRGVSWHAGKQKWRALLQLKRVPKKNVHLGYFTDEEEAARAYDREAKNVQDHPVLNFLDNGDINPDRQLVGFQRKLGSSEGDVIIRSQYRGVGWYRKLNKWRARITVGQGKTRELGSFHDEVEAARAYDRAAKQYHDNPVLNFPPPALEQQQLRSQGEQLSTDTT